MVSQPATKAISKKAKTSRVAPAPKADVKSTASHPSWKDMVKDCITEHSQDARTGVSRATIKKFISEKYNVEFTGMNASQLNRAIAHGAEHGIFSLPKGPSGKVKLAPKLKPAPANENVKPLGTKKTNKDTSAAAPSAKPAVKKVAVKKATAAPKKTSSAKVEKKKPAAKAAVAAKAASKAKPASKAKTATKKTAAKPKSAAKPQSAAKPISATKPRSTKTAV
ncbi:predicted protein [Sparassis crispa]|uniref:Histone H1 n=1 Tax=Sparassis crispa TaxID=139825 RepID=A0A401GJQ6_9APHY|nr:predicted protein [Sparassis crispa]GBE82395.1 predicted protein [Sparassis crispa]